MTTDTRFHITADELKSLIPTAIAADARRIALPAYQGRGTYPPKVTILLGDTARVEDGFFTGSISLTRADGAFKASSVDKESFEELATVINRFMTPWNEKITAAVDTVYTAKDDVAAACHAVDIAKDNLSSALTDLRSLGGCSAHDLASIVGIPDRTLYQYLRR